MKILLVLLSILFLTSCNNASDKDKTVVDTMQVLKHAVAESFGMPPDSVDIQDTTFIIAGDGIVGMSDAVERFGYLLQDERIGEVTAVTQMMSYYKVNTKLYPVVKIYADNTVTQDWLNALDSAIIYCNNIGAGIRFRRQTEPSGYTTKVITVSTVSSTIATAAYPSYYGGPGNRITINLYQSGLHELQKIHAIAHELWHLAGFSHTNGTFGSIVTGTPSIDPGSVMNSTVAYWNGFSDYDIQAIRKVYP